MMKIAAAFIAMLFLTGPVVASTAPSLVNGDLDKAIAIVKGGAVLPYLETTLRLSRYKRPAVVPVIALMTNQWFIDTQCNGVAEKCTVIGAFYAKLPTILYVREGLNEVRHAGVIVHEMAHFLQFHNGWLPVWASCPDSTAHEAEAYAIEYRFYVENGAANGFTVALPCMQFRGALR